MTGRGGGELLGDTPNAERRKRLGGDAAIGLAGVFRWYAVRLFEREEQGLMMILQSGIEDNI
jgi:hypothetical protein